MAERKKSGPKTGHIAKYCEQLEKLLSRKKGCSLAEAEEKLDITREYVRYIINQLRMRGIVVNRIEEGVFKIGE